MSFADREPLTKTNPKNSRISMWSLETQGAPTQYIDQQLLSFFKTQTMAAMYSIMFLLNMSVATAPSGNRLGEQEGILCSPQTFQNGCSNLP